jgi:transcriptional regulator with XRE-family HTH domain
MATIFAERVKALRKEQQFTQATLAAAVHVSRGLVSVWEIGESMPRAEELAALAHLFNTTTDYLLGVSDERNARRHESSPASPAAGAYDNTAAASGQANPMLPPTLEQMFAQHRLRGTAHIVVFTNGALSAEEVDALRRGVPPTAFNPDKLLAFFRKFDIQLIRRYYQQAQLPLPQQYADLEAELRTLMDRIYMSTDRSPEALAFVIQLAKEEFDKGK